MTQPRNLGSTSDHRLRAQIWSLLRALFSSRYRYKIALLATAIVAVVLATTYGQVQLNAWQKTFWDALGIRSISAVTDQVILFLIIVSGLLAIGVTENWLQAILKVRLREWLTHDLFDVWLGPKRAYLLAHAGETGANPDQYIQADAKHLTEMSAGLAIDFLRSGLLLVSFIGVLWGLSSGVVFTYDGHPFTIPGYMVWCALAYAGAGSFLTWLVGRPLIKLNAERYAREADLRFAIVRLNESVDSVTLHGGEHNERRLVNNPFADVVKLSVQLAKGHAKLTWVTSGYGWLAMIVPILVAAPGYFGGSLSLGELMMVVGAFSQVQNALRWFVEHFAALADWRATLLRVAGFRDRLAELTPTDGGAGGISVAKHAEEKLEFQQFAVLSAHGLAALDTTHAEIAIGDRVLIAGACGSGKSRLLRAVAGLWTQGRGSILLPPSGDMMFVPPRPYMPLGSLRAAIAYPSDEKRFDELAVHLVLMRVGLARLASRLDEKERWDKVLSPSEQQRVSLARLLLHQPRWIFLEDATGSIDAGDLQLMLSIFEDELAQSTVIGTASAPALANFYRRTLRLVPVDSVLPHDHDEAHNVVPLLEAAE